MPDKNAPPWQFIPLNQYKSPAGPTTETVRNHLRTTLRRLRLSDRADQRDASIEREGELTSIPDFLIEQAAPEPDWRTLHCQTLDQGISALAEL